MTGVGRRIFATALALLTRSTRVKIARIEMTHAGRTQVGPNVIEKYKAASKGFIKAYDDHR